MLEGEAPRLFGLPPGADFPRELLAGIETRLAGQPPEAWARVQIFVNSGRMARRLTALFEDGPARLLPRIRLVTALGTGSGNDLPPPVPALRRRLELSHLVAALLEREPDPVPRASLYDLSDSLAALMDEMQSEGVAPEALAALDMGPHAAHWARSRRFIELVARYFGGAAAEAPDTEARQRLSIERLVARWEETPPQTPVIVAGSTGSRGATALFMAAVARLPQGAVVLPGFDFDQPGAVWEGLDDALTGEDHPQFRFRRLLDRLTLGPEAVQPWRRDTAPAPARNRLVSLALRPAPVTDQWMAEGPGLTELDVATADVTLIEAPSARIEAQAIALRLRKAVEDGATAALITPDRTLTRQVAGALDRWGIVPDDSAGTPLPLSAPGRLLRHVASLFGEPLTSEALLVLLKHPLTNSTADSRGDHLRWTRELELDLRRHGPAFPRPADLVAWADKGPEDGRRAWAQWLGELLGELATIGTRPLSDHVRHHRAVTEALAGGPPAGGSGELWQKAAGEAAQAAVDELVREARHGSELSPADYRDLFRAILNRQEVREATRSHPGVMIWGTLEARVQGADLVILAGLNDGVWPALPPPDPWLNREMRKKVGLTVPERRVGLAAHDFQQAIGARQVVLTRAVRDAEAETVPSRWLNRLTNLLGGLAETGGVAALDAMRQRGSVWLARAEALDRPAQPAEAAPRPAPCPPVESRPARLAVTAIRTLIRDPYAIYARQILRLAPLDPLRPVPDAPLRGTILHRVMERFLREGPPAADPAARAALLAIAGEELAAQAPWPAARRMWLARLARVADRFLEEEAGRQAGAGPAALEQKGTAELAVSGVTLTARPDRIDREADGALAIYDYKTGAPPTWRQMEAFDKQLMLEAAMAERGVFTDRASETVPRVVHIGLGASPRTTTHALEPGQTDRIWDELEALIATYSRRDRGYAARAAMESRTAAGDFDHLARFGEWDETDAPQPRRVGR